MSPTVVGQAILGPLLAQIPLLAGHFRAIFGANPLVGGPFWGHFWAPPAAGPKIREIRPDPAAFKVCDNGGPFRALRPGFSTRAPFWAQNPAKTGILGHLGAIYGANPPVGGCTGHKHRTQRPGPIRGKDSFASKVRKRVHTARVDVLEEAAAHLKRWSGDFCEVHGVDSAQRRRSFLLKVFILKSQWLYIPWPFWQAVEDIVPEVIRLLGPTISPRILGRLNRRFDQALLWHAALQILVDWHILLWKAAHEV